MLEAAAELDDAGGATEVVAAATSVVEEAAADEITTGVPAIVAVPMATGRPVSNDPSASSVTVISSVTITLSVTTTISLFRTSNRPATFLTSKEVAKRARVEKVERILSYDILNFRRFFCLVDCGMKERLSIQSVCGGIV